MVYIAPIGLTIPILYPFQTYNLPVHNSHLQHAVQVV